MGGKWVTVIVVSNMEMNLAGVNEDSSCLLPEKIQIVIFRRISEVSP